MDAKDKISFIRLQITNLQNKCVLVERNPSIQEKYKRMQIDDYHEQIKVLRDQIKQIQNETKQPIRNNQSSDKAVIINW
jgi:hypothetical protein